LHDLRFQRASCVFNPAAAGAVPHTAVVRVHGGELGTVLVFVFIFRPNGLDLVVRIVHVWLEVHQFFMARSRLFNMQCPDVLSARRIRLIRSLPFAHPFALLAIMSRRPLVESTRGIPHHRLILQSKPHRSTRSGFITLT
jgi:hypothetical protein